MAEASDSAEPGKPAETQAQTKIPRQQSRPKQPALARVASEGVPGCIPCKDFGKVVWGLPLSIQEASIFS